MVVITISAPLALTAEVTKLALCLRRERKAELREQRRLGKLNARIRFLVENTVGPANANSPVLGDNLHPLRTPGKA